MYWIYFLLVCTLFYPLTVQGIESRVFEAQKLRHEIHKYLVKLDIDRPVHYSICSGSIISTKRIITSAHCVTITDLQGIRVYHNQKNGLEKIGEADLNETAVHPSYKVHDETHYSRLVDIALLKTKVPMMYNKYVQPIELASFVPSNSATAILTGYGEHEEGDEMRDAREGAVLITHCPHYVQDLICSEDKVRAGSGDSGGALVYKKRLVGVTSASCRDVYLNKPCITIFSNVPKSLGWIRNQLIKDDQ